MAEPALTATVDQLQAEQESLSRQVAWTWIAIVSLAVITMIASRRA